MGPRYSVCLACMRYWVQSPIPHKGWKGDNSEISGEGTKQDPDLWVAPGELNLNMTGMQRSISVSY